MTDGFDEKARTRGIRRVLLITLALNLLVAAAKVAVGTALGSLSIRADGFHSSTDGLNNVVLLLGVWLASAPPDREHPYGHRKFEVLAAGAVGIGLLIAAFNVLSGVLDRVRGLGSTPDIDLRAFAVLGATLAVNVFVATYEARAARKLMSPGLLSDALHTRSDVLITVGVAVSTLFVWRGLVWLDAVAGGLIAAYIAFTGLRVLRENAGYLLDTTLVDPADVLGAARSVSGVSGARDARSRGTPGGVFVDLIIEVAAALPVGDAHALAHRVEAAVKIAVPGVVGVQVHVEPEAAPVLAGAQERETS